MTRKIPFSKLEQTCSACPSQWELLSHNLSVYIRYRGDHFKVYIKDSPVCDIIDCIEEENLVLSIHGLKNDPYNGYMTNRELFDLLAHHNLLEQE